MLDYNTLNNLVEFFNKNGIKNIQLESGSTIEVKEGSLLVNGEEVGGAEYTAGDGISIENNTITNTKPNKQLYNYLIQVRDTDANVDINVVTTVNILPSSNEDFKNFIKRLLKGLTSSYNPYLTVVGIGRIVLGSDYYTIIYNELIVSDNHAEIGGFHYYDTTSAATRRTKDISSFVNNHGYWVIKNEL